MRKICHVVADSAAIKNRPLVSRRCDLHFMSGAPSAPLAIFLLCALSLSFSPLTEFESCVYFVLSTKSMIQRSYKEQTYRGDGGIRSDRRKSRRNHTNGVAA